MAETSGRAELQERMNELATRLVLDGADSGLAGELARLSESARAKGCPETARMASELAATMQSDPSTIEATLGAGLARLQQVLEEEGRKAAALPAAPVPPSISHADEPASPANSLAQ